MSQPDREGPGPSDPVSGSDGRGAPSAAVHPATLAHSHSHSGGPAPERVRGSRVLYLIAGLLIVLTAVGMVLLRPGTGRTVTAEVPDRGQRVEATVTSTTETPCDGQNAQTVDPLGAPRTTCLALTLRPEQGPEAGQSITLLDNPDLTLGAKVGQHLVLTRANGDLTVDQRYELTDVQRGAPLLLMAAIFAVAVIALGRWRGALALVGLAVSLLVLVGWLVPALLDGQPALLTATVGASAVMIVALGLSHGPSLRTVVAMLGTAASLLLIIALSTVFVELTTLTGLTSEEAQYVRVYFGQVDPRGLLLAGIVIGALGILDDVTVTQVSTVWELRVANPTMANRDLFAAALRVGRDHIASTVNTLLLAYAGASLPLLVIFTTSGDSLTDTLTNGLVGQEIVRTLAGSIGLVAAVPITTALAAYICPARSTEPPTASVKTHRRHRSRRQRAGRDNTGTASPVRSWS